MTPFLKAEQLIKKFDIKHIIKLPQGAKLPVSMYSSQVKSCAIEAASEVIQEINQVTKYLKITGKEREEIERTIDFWEKVIIIIKRI